MEIHTFDIDYTKELEHLYELYKNNKSRSLYEEILNIVLPNNLTCRDCGRSIYYYDTQLTIHKRHGKYKISLKGKTYFSSRTLFDTKYSLNLCEDCLTKKHPEYQTKNKARVFNLTTDITATAYNIPLDTACYFRKMYNSVTLENLVRKYGEIEGSIRWQKYCKAQSLTNTLEYKKEKYNMSETEFKEYNQSRAVTLNNLIKRHGENIGAQKWEDYCKQQAKTKSFEFMVNKFGLEKTLEINKSKANTLQNFQKRYGQKEGYKKYMTYINKTSDYFSKESQIFFNRIDTEFNRYGKTYYATKNGEFGVMTKKLGYKKLDYFILSENVCIEYNGSLFHAGPEYKDNEKPNPWSNLTALEIRQNDIERYETLYNEKGIRTFVVWDYDINNANLLTELRNFINNKNINYKI